MWGLDDYQFLPFLWGSAQLAGHPAIKPMSIHSADLLATHAPDYLYLSCVQFVKDVRGRLMHYVTVCACAAMMCSLHRDACILLNAACRFARSDDVVHARR